jgi:hypothetical protein
MMLAIEHRMNNDERCFGELFYSVCDELPDITWLEAFRILMATFMAIGSEKLHLTEDELESMINDFMSALPLALKNKITKLV